MSRFVVDACVAIKWLVSEEHSDAALRLIRQNHDMIAPSLFLSEIANVLWKKRQQGQIEGEKARKALRGLFGAGVEIYTMDSLVCDALDISLAHGCSVYDGVYLALAAREQCPLVTADRKFIAMMGSTEFAQRLVWIEHAKEL
jgi:predicted nucleic acid-binding protein